MTKENFRYFSFTFTHTIYLPHMARFCTHLSIFFSTHNSLSLDRSLITKWPNGLNQFPSAFFFSSTWSLCLSKWQEDFCVFLRYLIYIYYIIETFNQYLTFFKVPTFLCISIIIKNIYIFNPKISAKKNS